MNWQPVAKAPMEPDASVTFEANTYLVTDGHSVATCDFARGNGAGKPWADWSMYGGIGAGRITHWMPLPAAPDAVLAESKAMAAAGDRVGALKHYRAGKGCSLEEARDALYPGELTHDFPAGAIHNGRVHAGRLEATGLECDAGSLQLCNDWVEFRRCFEHLAQWAEGQGAKESP
ncbi:hypothetical protein HMPREF9701_04952 [Delftia acidovorans CCUG 274B]|uniref:phage protein n=1 Tax=Delftia acidovorans TaxID=80866 RepID=UPI000352EF48|nr:phage protein [Delftia acidovorans]EPD35919.1 hypothetical protein HMPREF9701_04952 [Delftia acidovorans CCUG 274B]